MQMKIMSIENKCFWDFNSFFLVFVFINENFEDSEQMTSKNDYCNVICISRSESS